MSGLLGKLMQNARKAEIGYGVHSNCVVLSVSNEEKRTKDNEKINRNCYTKIGQCDKNGVVVGEREVSWFNIDSTSDYAFDNLKTQLTQMTAIVDVFVSAEKGKWEKAIDKAINDATELELDGEDIDEDEKQLAEAMKDKATCKEMMEAIGEAYVKILKDKLGDKSQPVRFKVVYEKSGKYLQQPRYGKFVESMEVEDEDSILKITKADEEALAKSLAVAKPKAKTKL